MAQDIEINLERLHLQSGEMLHDHFIRARLYGRAGAPLVIMLGGISATRFVADGPDNTPGWWSALVRKDGPVDLNTVQVLGLDFAPSAETATPPLPLSTHDQAKRLAIVLDYLGIKKTAAIIGASYGGMVALAFAKAWPERVSALCIISASHRPFPLGVAWRGIQRRIVRMAIEAGRPDEGLALARELAMTTYRSAEEFTKRFDAVPTGEEPTRFDVCDYLLACGQKFTKTMTPERFLALSESIDMHRIDPTDLQTPTLLIASRSDQLAPPEEMQTLCDTLAGPSKLVTLDSPFGHDAFLKETRALGTHLCRFISEIPHDD